jgi:hypothetical protein
MISRSMSSALATGLLFWSVAASLGAERPPVARTSRPGSIEYRRVSFNELIGGELKTPIPVSFEIPASYVRRVLRGQPGVHVWGTAKDLDRLEADPEKSISRSVQDGLILAELSASTGYDQRSGKFTAEDSMRQQLRGSGATGVTVMRHDVGKYPTLRTTARVQGKWIRALHVALLQDTFAGFIDFREPGQTAIWYHFLGSAREDK